MVSYKITVIGDSGVGKSSILVRLIHNKFQVETSSTIGASFFTYCLDGYRDLNESPLSSSPLNIYSAQSNSGLFSYFKPTEGTSLKTRLSENMTSTENQELIRQRLSRSDPRRLVFEIWDTAGQERFMSLVPMYLRNCNCILVVYDANNPASFNNCKRCWIPLIHSYFKETGSLPFIVLIENKIDLVCSQVISSDASQYAQDNGMMFWRTSSKNGIGITSLFEELAKVLPQKQIPISSRQLSVIPDKPIIEDHSKVEEQSQCSSCWKSS